MFFFQNLFIHFALEVMSSQNPFITCTSTDWRLCCLCQKQSRDQLRKPYTQARWHSAYESLENDLRNFAANDIPFPLGLHLGCLDDGSGISNTLLKNNAVYHNACRTLCRPVMLEREIRKRTISHHEEDTSSPKKTRLSFNASFNREIPQCVYCEKYKEDSGEDLFRARSANCGKNLLNWAIESKNWAVHSRLHTAISAEDTIAADVHYHSSCYTKLKNAARAAKSKTSVDTQCPGESQTYDPLVFAELLAFVKFGQSPFKLSVLRNLYLERLKVVGSGWINTNIHPTRFKEHIIEKLGSDWSAFQQGREVYISHKQAVGEALAETARLQVTEDEAQKIVDVGLMLRKYVILQQMPFDGSFHNNCLSEPVAKPLLTLLNILLEGSRSICSTTGRSCHVN